MRREASGTSLSSSCSPGVSRCASLAVDSAADFAGGPQPTASCRASIASRPSFAGSGTASGAEGDCSTFTDCSVMTFSGLEPPPGGRRISVGAMLPSAPCREPPPVAVPHERIVSHAESRGASEGSELERVMMRRRREIDDRTVLYTKEGMKEGDTESPPRLASDGSALSGKSSGCKLALQVPSPCRRRRGQVASQRYPPKATNETVAAAPIPIERTAPCCPESATRSPTATAAAEAAAAAAEAAALSGSSGWGAAAAAVAAAHALARGEDRIEIQGRADASEDASASLVGRLASTIASEKEGDVPQLLALVQATCECLTERMKKQQPAHQSLSRSSQQEASAAEPREEALAAAIAAASATRDLLGEVEMAFLGGGSRSRACSEASSRGGCLGADALPGFGGLCPSPRAGTQWFSVSTPTEAGAFAVPSASSLCPLGARPTRNRGQRHSWPCAHRLSGSGGDSTESSTNASPGVPVDSLCELTEEVRQPDPCPLIRPPRVAAPQSPRGGSRRPDAWPGFEAAAPVPPPASCVASR